MPQDPLILILVIFGSLVFGLIFGIVIANTVHKRKKSAQKKAQPVPQVEAPPPTPLVEPAPVPLAQLWRDETGSALQVEMAGRRYLNVADLNKEERARMVDLLREWVTWLGFNQPRQPAAPPPAARPAPSPASEATPQAVEKPAEEASASAPAADGEKKAASTARSMVDQVDDILREMQADLPPTAPRVKLMGDMQHGVVVWIGLEHYNGIENVPDENARQLLKRAVAEWERRTS